MNTNCPVLPRKSCKVTLDILLGEGYEIHDRVEMISRQQFRQFLLRPMNVRNDFMRAVRDRILPGFGTVQQKEIMTPPHCKLCAGRADNACPTDE